MDVSISRFWTPNHSMCNSKHPKYNASKQGQNIKPCLHHARHIVSIALEQALGMASYYHRQVHTQCIVCTSPCLLCMVAFPKFVLRWILPPSSHIGQIWLIESSTIITIAFFQTIHIKWFPFYCVFQAPNVRPPSIENGRKNPCPPFFRSFFTFD
jgi:hypothetical protein